MWSVDTIELLCLSIHPAIHVRIPEVIVLLEYAEWEMMKLVEMSGHFSTHIGMCPSDTALKKE